jgi:hypothetical protein
MPAARWWSASRRETANVGYHEGSYDGPGGYWVNVRSRARGLLALLLFTDVGPDDAPTRLVCDLICMSRSSWRLMVRRAPALMPSSGGRRCCAGRSRATGEAGDIFLCHPFVVHTATWPHRGDAPRMIAQPAVHVRDGFALDGSDPSLVARAIVRGCRWQSRPDHALGAHRWGIRGENAGAARQRLGD